MNYLGTFMKLSSHFYEIILPKEYVKWDVKSLCGHIKLNTVQHHGELEQVDLFILMLKGQGGLPPILKEITIVSRLSTHFEPEPLMRT